MDGADEAAAHRFFFEEQVGSICSNAKKGGMTLNRELGGMVLEQMEKSFDALSPGARRKQAQENWERWQCEPTPQEEAAKVCAVCICPPQLQIACRLYA